MFIEISCAMAISEEEMNHLPYIVSTRDSTMLSYNKADPLHLLLSAQNSKVHGLTESVRNSALKRLMPI